MSKASTIQGVRDCCVPPRESGPDRECATADTGPSGWDSSVGERSHRTLEEEQVTIAGDDQAADKAYLAPTICHFRSERPGNALSPANVA
jgi:hypothetical protein